MSAQHTITQGEFFVSAQADDTISTLLGSCVACCLWDPVAKVGGMNHILLATTSRNATASDYAGVNAMELLINGILKLGGHRDRLLAKAFGGAQMIEGLSGIGQANCDFTERFLQQENILCVSKSLGGTTARQVIFAPSTGKVRVRAQTDKVVTPAPTSVAPVSNGLELF